MELQKRDRGSVRTARDIERKYNLGRIAENEKKANMASEQIEKLLEDTKELENQYALIEETVNENKQKIDDLEDNKANQSDVEQLANSKADKIEIEQLEDCIAELENNKADKEDLKSYYTKEELNEKLKDLTAGLPSFLRKIIYYETTEDFEVCFRMPSDYKEGCLVDVFINGLKLERSKYSIDLQGGRYLLVLEDGLDVIGTMVEIDMIEGVKEGEL